MYKYEFYYDESEHSRKINYKTVSADNYYDNFVTVIVGWLSESKDVLYKYSIFEEKYSDRKNKTGEIKSTVLKQRDFQYGFASLNKQNAIFLNDFLSIFNEDVHIYFSVNSKIEYLILQLFKDYKSDRLIDTELMKYSIVKALVAYRPKEIIECIYKSPKEFLVMLKKFFRERIECNKENYRLKHKETEAFETILSILNRISTSFEIDWDYHMSFNGFKKYLKEKALQNYVLILDKEGEEGKDSKTIEAAREIGLDNLYEVNSLKYPGLRISDMIAGILSKLQKGLCVSLKYNSYDDGINKKILNKKWFDVNEVQLELYKKMYQLICEWQPAWYKSYAGIYSDDLILLIALLNFMNQFESVETIRESLDMQGEYFNAFACSRLSTYFNQRSCKLPLEPVISLDEESYLNCRGAKVYFDYRKQPLLILHEGAQTLDVLSVGVDRNNIPTITILKNGEPECFRLPEDLVGWAIRVIGIASMGMNLFPTKVVFTKLGEKHYVDIL